MIDTYQARASNFIFPSNSNRLRVNPVPDGTSFETWRIAQMHPLLAQNVSDFIVEFAADIVEDGTDVG